MLDGKPAVFISCSEKYKKDVAYRFRDVIHRTQMRPLIVSDAPKLINTWTPEEKVEAYLNRADVLLALCTPDNQLIDGTWEPRQNIIDELSRARGKHHLRDRICVLKEPSVMLPSNINPVYDRLDLLNVQPAIAEFTVQMREWGFDVPDLCQGIVEEPRNYTEPPELLTGLRPDDPSLALAHVRQLFTRWSKAQQREYVDRALGVIRFSAQWEDRAIAGHILEAVVELDSNLLTVDVLDELSIHKDSSVRSSAAVILFILACTTPGLVPVDIVTRLVKPTDEDWYVFTPAMNALKQLTFTRPEAIAALVDLAKRPERDNREYAAVAFRDLARIRPAIIPLDVIIGLASDADSAISRIAREVQGMVIAVPEAERAHPYSPFTPF